VDAWGPLIIRLQVHYSLHHFPTTVSKVALEEVQFSLEAADAQVLRTGH
jgi:hypothetical protein